jgi:hypothetical protein
MFGGPPDDKSEAGRGCAESGNAVLLVVESRSEGHRRHVGATMLRRPELDEVLLGKTREGIEQKTLLLGEERPLLLLGFFHVRGWLKIACRNGGELVTRKSPLLQG